MADLCTSRGPVCPVSEGQSGGSQLVVTGLHGCGHTAELWDHMDAGHLRATDHGIKHHQGLCVICLMQCNGLMCGTLLFLLFFYWARSVFSNTVTLRANSNCGMWGLLFVTITQSCNQMASYFKSVALRNSQHTSREDINSLMKRSQTLFPFAVTTALSWGGSPLHWKWC